MDAIKKFLKENADAEYAAFTSRIIPNVNPKSIVGVRTPALRAFAKTLKADAPQVQKFLAALPHKHFEENQLHSFVVSGIKDFDQCAAEVERFLPYIDNWATCDQCSPGRFKKHKAELLPRVKGWLKSGRVYTIRFGIVTLMRHFLDDDFKPEFLKTVSAIKSDEYYIKMAAAWFFAEALAKQWDAALPYIKEKRLDAWVHNKAIQKARESFRVPDDKKELLAGLKI